MDNETFEASVKNTVDTFTSTLFKKNAGYASDEDRLHNFKAAGIAQGITPEQALRGMTTKHTISINDLVWRGGDDVPMEVWKEKIGDEFNYLIFLMALIEERESQKVAERDVSIGEGPELTTPSDWTEKVLDSNKVAVKNPLVEEPAYLERVRTALNIPSDLREVAEAGGYTKIGYMKSGGMRVFFRDHVFEDYKIVVLYPNGATGVLTKHDINYHGEVIS